MKKTFLFALISIIVVNAKGQFIDKFGLKIGAGTSNLYWETRGEFGEKYTDWKKEKEGITIRLFAEKNLNKYLSIRPKIGYIQKGFRDDHIITNLNGDTVANTINKGVTLHDISADIGLKFRPFNCKINPYLIVGLRGDYLLDYNDYEIEIDGIKYREYESILDDYKKFTIGGLIGVGLEYKDLIFIDFEYNPAITKNYEYQNVMMKYRYFEVTIGLNISGLIK